MVEDSLIRIKSVHILMQFYKHVIRTTSRGRGGRVWIEDLYLDLFSLKKKEK